MPRQVILDTSTLINLTNGRVLEEVLQLQNTNLCVGAIVKGEFEEEPRLRQLVEPRPDLATMPLTLLPADVITVREFRQAFGRYRLGDGETECIAVARKRPVIVCSDDARARACCTAEFGRERVTGSIGLLRQLVIARGMTERDAMSAWKRMVDAGGYLPEPDVGLLR